MDRLDRFRNAQEAVHEGFESALAEIRGGRKRGHWIWYVFPQIAGLGLSDMSQAYAIDGEPEAVAYLRDATLRSRLLTITEAVGEQLRAGRALAAVMGSDIDAKKLVSSLTLFGHVARQLADGGDGEPFRQLATAAGEVLARAAAHGYPRCACTLGRLGVTPR
jgi:uncharacterized protein (DUF1810 family)